MPRPELKSVEDLGLKREKPKATPTPKPESDWARLKQVGGMTTYLPAGQAGKYLSDAAEGMKK